MAIGFGVDMSLTSKLVVGRLVRGKALVFEAVYRRLITPRGSLFYDLTYGLDVSGFIGAVGFDQGAAVIGGMVEGELGKEDRIYNVRCTATLTTQADGTSLLLLEITGTLHGEDEDFALTLGVTDVTVEILKAS